jgi:hypothetical protein
VKNDVETSPSNVVSVERLKKKVAEDDFIVDYHYGDSVSNDDEVARINAKLAEKQRRKFSVGEGTSQVTISSSTSDSSYYPSTNSEFSTPGKMTLSLKRPFAILGAIQIIRDAVTTPYSFFANPISISSRMEMQKKRLSLA